MTNSIELTEVQEQTIKQSFKIEHLKDELELAKLFTYDFDDIDDE